MSIPTNGDSLTEGQTQKDKKMSVQRKNKARQQARRDGEMLLLNQLRDAIPDAAKLDRGDSRKPPSKRGKQNDGFRSRKAIIEDCYNYITHARRFLGDGNIEKMIQCFKAEQPYEGRQSDEEESDGIDLYEAFYSASTINPKLDEPNE